MTFKSFENKTPVWLILCVIIIFAVSVVTFLGVFYLIISHRCNIIRASSETPFKEVNRIPEYAENKINNDVEKPLNGSLNEHNFRIINRKEWKAEYPTKPTPLTSPALYVIIMHTATPTCYGEYNCTSKVRIMQHYHTQEKHWSDILYNFLISGDGLVYEGRGWQIQGGHNHRFNSNSIEIAAIGNFDDEVPKQKQINSIQDLIKLGIRTGYIDEHYKLLGAKQIQNTRSPGVLLYEIVKSWPHWVAHP